MISAGEASGDLHAANLAHSLRELDPDIHLIGMGSQKMREAGVELLVDSTDLAVVGIVEVLANWRKIFGALNRLREAIRNSPPDLLILVDYQEFNLKLAQCAKENGVKVLFYIGPQLWAWRPRRVKKIGRLIDMMAVIFPFEVGFYEKALVPVRFVGNPLVDKVKPSLSPEQAREAFGLKAGVPTVGLFPGSRRSEVKRLLPVELESAAILQRTHPDLQFVLPIADTLRQEDLDPFLTQYPELPITLVKSQAYNVMQVCDAIITASGTATLEIALMGVPMVIIYKVAPLSYAIMSRLITIDNIGLANIVAEKNIVREFVQHDARPEPIADEITRILTDTTYREDIIRQLGEVKEKLGESGGSRNIAELSYEMLHRPK